MMKVLVFGEILWDIIEGTPHLGGAPLNFAAHIRQCGSPSGIVSSLGEDELGNRAMDSVKDLGVFTEHIQRSEIKTGTVPVSFINGQPDYEIIRDVAYDYIDEDLLNHTELNAYNVFYFGSLIQRSRQSSMALTAILRRHQFEHVFYDVNLRKDCYNKEIVEFSLKHCTILKVNDEEVEVLSPMLFGVQLGMKVFCERIIRDYPQVKLVVITAGAAGCYVYEKNDLILVPTQSIEVVDTVGAGDAFSAAFLSAYQRFGDAEKAATIANQIGAFVASSRGPIPQYTKEMNDLFLIAN